jgi:hypothetical protein
MEKEWLLLGEPSSPVNRSDQQPLNAESSILSDVTTSDTECIVKVDQSDSESEEDIDSIVEEVQQKLKVSTAGLKETNLKIPSMGSWRIAMLCILSVLMSGAGAAISSSYQLVIPFALSVAGNFSLFDNHLAIWFKFKWTHFNSCLRDFSRHVMASKIHLLTWHACDIHVHLLVSLQLHSHVNTDTRQLVCDNFLVRFGNLSCDAVIDEMRRLVLFMFGVPDVFWSTNGVDWRKFDSQRIIETPNGNNHNSIEESTDWIIGD